MPEYINIILEGLRKTNLKMWESQSKVYTLRKIQIRFKNPYCNTDTSVH